MTRFTPTGGLYEDGLGERRTSVLAIVALVLSLVCFVPGLSLVGTALGVAALLIVGKSGGRLGGRGLAILAIVLGLIVTAVWLGIVVAGTKFAGMYQQMGIQPAERFMQAVEARDYQAARAIMTQDGAARVSDADFDAFRDGYRGALGAFKSTPSGVVSLMQEYMEIGPLLQNMKPGMRDVFPVPATFEKGRGVLLLQIDQRQTGSGAAIAPVNLIVKSSPTTSWLLYRGEQPPALPEVPAPAPAPALPAPAPPAP